MSEYRCMTCDVIFLDPGAALEHFAQHRRDADDDEMLRISLEQHPSAVAR